MDKQFGHQITIEDANQAIELRIGDNLRITLPSNSTTGFEWKIKNLDEKILRINSEIEFNTPNNIIGEEGETIMQFVAVNKGQTILTINYHRPFEKGVPPIQTFEVTVNVE